MSQPDFNNGFYKKHGHLLCFSFQHWTGRPLVAAREDPVQLILDLFNAPFVLVSHGTEDIPIFNFGNKAALELFNLEWEQFIRLQSQESAEAISRDERDKLLTRVNTDGYINDYSGVRITSTGKRFLIEDATVWNIVDHSGVYHGQAAMYENWSYI